jgi:hypothetical protein
VKRQEATEARYGAPGFSGAAPLATREAKPTGLAAVMRSGLGRWVKTAAITLGVMYAAGWVLLTLGVAARNHSQWAPRIWYSPSPMLAEARTQAIRSYALPADPAISLEEANRAFLALQVRPIRNSPATPRVRAVASEMPWRGMRLERDVFVDARRGSWGGPGLGVIEAARRPLSQAERDVLRMIGTAPGWRDFDIVARAGKLDRIGALFEMPIGSGARYNDLIDSRLMPTRELAQAAVARAAWHLSEGRTAEAERVLRLVVSYGFVLHDNSNSFAEQSIAHDVVYLGRVGLERLFRALKDPRGAEIEAAIAKAVTADAPASLATDFESLRAELYLSARSAETPRGIRYNALRGLLTTSCGSTSELVFGQSAATRDAFAQARADLARYPSERAQIDLLQGALEQPLAVRFAPNDEVALGALDVLGRIYFNPRLPACLSQGLDATSFRLY